MRLYLDDDSASALLARLLVQAGHEIEIPADAGLAGQPDPVHLNYAIRASRVLLTGNYQDFELLHELVVAAGGRHPGIFCVRFDNNPKRDLTARGIVNAIGNIVAAGVSTENQIFVLNHWR